MIWRKVVRELNRNDIGITVNLEVAIFNAGNSGGAPLQNFDGWYSGPPRFANAHSQFPNKHENYAWGSYMNHDGIAGHNCGRKPNWAEPEVRDYVLDNLEMWMDEYNFFRLSF